MMVSCKCKNSKRLIALGLIALFMATLGGCDKETETDETETPVAVTDVVTVPQSETVPESVVEVLETVQTEESITDMPVDPYAGITGDEVAAQRYYTFYENICLSEAAISSIGQGYADDATFITDLMSAAGIGRSLDDAYNITVNDALPGDLVLFSDRMGVFTEQNMMAYLDQGVVVSAPITSVATDFQFMRVCDTSQVDEEFFRATQTDIGYLDFHIDPVLQSDAAMIDGRVEDLEHAVGNYISSTGMPDKPRTGHITDINNTQFEDTCTIVVGTSIGAVRVIYTYSTQTFQVMN